jgi:hypothetical protein
MAAQLFAPDGVPHLAFLEVCGFCSNTWREAFALGGWQPVPDREGSWTLVFGNDNGATGRRPSRCG